MVVGWSWCSGDVVVVWSWCSGDVVVVWSCFVVAGNGLCKGVVPAITPY